MSTFVPMEASGGMMLLLDPVRWLLVREPLPARTTPPSPRSSLPCAKLVLGEALPFPVHCEDARHGFFPQ